MSRRPILCVFLILQFHACFASRALGFFHENLLFRHKDETLRSKEEETMPHSKGLTVNCRTNAELCIEAMQVSIKSASEGDVESEKRTPLLGIDLKVQEKQKQNRMMQQPDTKMVEARAALESASNPNAYEEGSESESGPEEPGEDIEVKDYATPRRKTPIHNEKRP